MVSTFNYHETGPRFESCRCYCVVFGTKPLIRCPCLFNKLFKHYANKCTRKAKAVNTISEGGDEEDRNVTINNKVFDYIWDTGSPKSFITSDHLKLLRLEGDIIKEKIFKTCLNQNFKCEKYIELEVIFKKSTILQKPVRFFRGKTLSLTK